ncbi:MAG: recombinase family protein [Bacteroidota bacterium]
MTKTSTNRRANLDLFQDFGIGKDRKTDNTNNRCLIYTRVSSRDQEDNTSLENQLTTCREYVLRNGWEAVMEFGGIPESAKSGAERKEFNRMLDFARKKRNQIRYIIVYSYDRFSREGGKAMYELDLLKAKGIFVRAATQPVDAESEMGSMMAEFQLLVSKADNEMRRSKAIAGMVSKMRKGYWVGIAPTGYRWDKNKGELVIHEEKGPLVAKAFQWKYTNPSLSNEEIRKRLKTRGLKLCKQSMSNIFRNPAYCGLIVHSLLKGEVLEGNHPPLVSRRKFLAANTRGWQVNEENRFLPLKRFMRCENCKTPMTGYLVKAKGIYYYKCRKNGCGNNKNAAKLGELFKQELKRIQVREVFIPLIAKELRATLIDLNKSKIDDQARLKKRLAELDKKLKRLKDRYILEEEISRADYEEYSEKLREERAELNRELAQTQFKTSNWLDRIEQAVEMASNLNVLWENGSYRTRQTLQNIAFPEGMYFDKANNRVRTPRVNEIFAVSSEISAFLAGVENKKGDYKVALSTWAPPLGLEPSTY